MPEQLGALDLHWIRNLLSRCVVHGDEQDQLFRIVTKIDLILGRGEHGTVREPERSTAA